MQSMFKQSNLIFGVNKIIFNFDENIIPKGLVNFDIKDRIDVVKVGEQVKLILSREMLDGNKILQIKVEAFEIRILKDKNISEKEIISYLEYNPDELMVAFSQISTIISNLTLFTPFKSVVTSPEYIGEKFNK